MDALTRKELEREKRRLKRKYDFAVQTFHNSRKKEQKLREKMRSTAKPYYRRAKEKEEQFVAVNKVKLAANDLKIVRDKYYQTLALLAGVPEIYQQNSKCIEDAKGDIHVYLGVYDPTIGQEHHGHWIATRDGTVRYARLPFEPRGSQNYIDFPEIEDDDPL
ncbi:hypothetical protein IKG20_02630 [Candidatus Saccharibacteria bacterium]|nr:hypothetical protein [Candidatus Saccharibacteria bacterium]